MQRVMTGETSDQHTAPAPFLSAALAHENRFYFLCIEEQKTFSANL